MDIPGTQPENETRVVVRIQPNIQLYDDWPKQVITWNQEICSDKLPDYEVSPIVFIWSK